MKSARITYIPGTRTYEVHVGMSRVDLGEDSNEVVLYGDKDAEFIARLERFSVSLKGRDPKEARTLIGLKFKSK